MDRRPTRHRLLGKRAMGGILIVFAMLMVFSGLGEPSSTGESRSFLGFDLPNWMYLILIPLLFVFGYMLIKQGNGGRQTAPNRGSTSGW